MKNNKKMQKLNLRRFLLVSNNYKSNKNLEKIDKIKDIIQELNSLLGKNIINKIMKTHKDYEFGLLFIRFLEFHRKLGVKEITKELNIKNQRLIESWYRAFPPRPIRTLLNIYFHDYHKINKEVMANLFGWGFGDGGITSELSYYFVCGKKHDLFCIRDYLNKRIPNLEIIFDRNFGKSLVKQVNGKVKNISSTNSWILYMRDSSFCKLLYSLGLPKGNKVLQKTEIPNWIKKGDKTIKRAFLNSIFEGELQKHKVQYNIKRNKIDICPITFGLSKAKDYTLNLVDFLDNIRDMLNEFNINSTKVEKPKPSNIRKDGLITYFTRFYISISALNTINFAKLIDYPFNKEKKEALLTAIKEAKVKIRRMDNQVIKYDKAVELYSKGLSLYKIAKELDIQYSTAKHWLKTKEHLPILINQDVGDTLAEIH